MKRALVLNISHNELRMILALKNMGYHVIGTGGIPGLVGEKFVDEYIQADYSDKERMLQIATEKNIDAICACCNDFGVLSAAWIAEQLGLPGHDSYETARILHHKDLFKKFAAEHNIPTPQAVGFESEENALLWVRNANYPLIVKPVDLTGGKGVNRVDNVPEAMIAVKDAFDRSRAKRIVVEPFIDGSQHAICTFLIDRKVVAVGSNNEYSFINPYKVEIDTYPADNISEVGPFLTMQIEKIADILGLTDGIFHMQYRMKDGFPWIIEPMRRVLGNLYGVPCGHLNKLNWDYWQAMAYCGESLEHFPRYPKQEGYWAYRAVMAPRDGVIKDVIVNDLVQKYIFDDFKLWEKGQMVQNHLQETLGFFFMKFDSREQMNRIMLDNYDGVSTLMENS